MADSRKFAGDLADDIIDTFTSRGQVYGPPEINFQNIANFWNAWIEARYGSFFKLDAVDVGHMSALIKKARLANSIDHRDSALDDATYTLLAAGVASLPAQFEAAEVEALAEAARDVCHWPANTLHPVTPKTPANWDFAEADIDYDGVTPRSTAEARANHRYRMGLTTPKDATSDHIDVV